MNPSYWWRCVWGLWEQGSARIVWERAGMQVVGEVGSREGRPEQVERSPRSKPALGYLGGSPTPLPPDQLSAASWDGQVGFVQDEDGGTDESRQVRLLAWCLTFSSSAHFDTLRLPTSCTRPGCHIDPPNASHGHC